MEVNTSFYSKQTGVICACSTVFSKSSEDLLLLLLTLVIASWERNFVDRNVKYFFLKMRKHTREGFMWINKGPLNDLNTKLHNFFSISELNLSKTVLAVIERIIIKYIGIDCSTSNYITDNQSYCIQSGDNSITHIYIFMNYTSRFYYIIKGIIILTGQLE